MRLISNIKDYYDGAMHQFGYADDIVFNRMCEVFTRTSEQSNIPKLDFGFDVPNNVNAVIGFCGKLYMFDVVSNPGYGQKSSIYYYGNEADNEKMLSIYEKNKDLSYEKRSKIPEYEISVNFVKNSGVYKADWWEHRYNVTKDSCSIKENHKIFQDLECPIFLYVKNGIYDVGALRGLIYDNTIIAGTNEKLERGHLSISACLIKNPILTHFHFQKMVDSYTAVQEIEMYLGRLATNNTPPMPGGSDKVIAESKGFDKYSFRKPPSKNKT